MYSTFIFTNFVWFLKKWFLIRFPPHFQERFLVPSSNQDFVYLGLKKQTGQMLRKNLPSPARIVSHRPCICGLAEHRKTCSNKQTTAADNSLPKSLVCPKCDRTFKRACGLGRHIKSCKGTLCNVTASTNTDETTRSETSTANEPPTSTEPESPLQSPVPDGTCKTQESPITATRQRNTHSTGNSQAFRPF